MDILMEDQSMSVRYEQQQELFEAIRHFSKFQSLGRLLENNTNFDDYIKEHLINRYEELFEVNDEPQ
jgi:hypothetical protein